MGGAVGLPAAWGARLLVCPHDRAARAVPLPDRGRHLRWSARRAGRGSRPGRTGPDQTERRGTRRRARLLATGAGSRSRPRRSRARRHRCPPAGRPRGARRARHPRRRRRGVGRRDRQLDGDATTHRRAQHRRCWGRVTGRLPPCRRGRCGSARAAADGGRIRRRRRRATRIRASHPRADRPQRCPGDTNRPQHEVSP